MSVQRTVANAALSLPHSVGGVYTFAQVSGASISRHTMTAARQAMSGWRAGASSDASPAGLRRTANVTYSACNNGLETALIQIGPSEFQAYVRAFYDNACTHLYQDMFLDIVATSQTQATATGTDTFYTTAGSVYDYDTVQLAIVQTSANSGSISVQTSDAPNANASPTSAEGIACTFSSTSLGCGVGAVAHLSSLAEDLGATLAFNATDTSSSNSDTIALNGTGSAYGATLNALSLMAGTFPTWLISGGSAQDTITFNGSITYLPSFSLAGMSLTVSDAADDGTVSITAAGTPVVVSGTIKQTDTGATIATFTTDASGNGTITYGNGTTGTITNWVVVT